MSDDLEPMVTACAECGESVTSYWTPNGCVSRPEEYVLVADWIFHSDCWDKKTNDYFAAEATPQNPGDAAPHQEGE